MSDETVQIVARREGVETDVTEAVQIAYDMVHASMNWGSGFLDSDEMAQIIALADTCGFDPPDAPYHTSSRDDWPKAQQKAKEIRALFKDVPVVPRA